MSTNKTNVTVEVRTEPNADTWELLCEDVDSLRPALDSYGSERAK